MEIIKKYKLIKNIFIPILVLAFFLAPVIFKLDPKNISLEFETSRVLAEDYETEFVPEPTLTKNTVGSNSVNLTATIEVKHPGTLDSGKALATATTSGNPPVITVTNPGTGYSTNPKITLGGGVCSVTGTVTATKFNESGGITEIKASGWTCSVAPTSVVIESSGSLYDSYGSYSAIEGNGIDPGEGFFIDLTNKKTNITKALSFKDIGLQLDILKAKNVFQFTLGSAYIAPETDYSVVLRVEEGNSSDTYTYPTDPITFTTPAADAGDPPSVGTGGTGTAEGDGILELNCGLFNLDGCIAQIFYLVFKISAFIGKLAGWFLDFLIYYSTNDVSYRSEFVVQGWKTLRDISNIFFIIALLYIAIKTILNLNVSSNKKIISYVVIIALLINFSLFFTQVIIDSTNILAKVFYNNISAVDKNGVAVSAAGEKSISVGLISKFNPQTIVTKKVYNETGGTALFIFVTILATFIVLYAAYIFFQIGILFVGRVVMLWISMIFAPIAFASYTLPFKIPGVGHDEWWGELLKNAFMAPIFIFFLYIIVMFAGFLNTIVSFPEGADFMQKIMSVVIPFAILMVLLMKAKEIAIKFSGELGAQLQKAGSAIAGLAMGGAMGVVAGGAGVIGRATLGRWGSAMGKSEMLKDAEAKGGFTGFLAGKFRDIGTGAGKASFDVRGIKAVNKGLSKAGIATVGAIGVGGFDKKRADYVAKRQRRAESLKLGEDSELKQQANKLDADLHGLNDEAAKEMESIDKLIEKKRQEAQDAEREFRAASPQDKAAKQVALNIKNAQLKEAKDRKDALRNGQSFTYINDKNEEVTQRAYLSHDGKSLNALENEKKDIDQDIRHANHHRMQEYADSLSAGMQPAMDMIMSLGQHTAKATREAQHKILTGAAAPAASKSESFKWGSGGGGHGGGGHGGGHDAGHGGDHGGGHGGGHDAGHGGDHGGGHGGGHDAGHGGGHGGGSHGGGGHGHH